LPLARHLTVMPRNTPKANKANIVCWTPAVSLALSFWALIPIQISGHICLDRPGPQTAQLLRRPTVGAGECPSMLLRTIYRRPPALRGRPNLAGAFVGIGQGHSSGANVPIEAIAVNLPDEAPIRVTFASETPAAVCRKLRCGGGRHCDVLTMRGRVLSWPCHSLSQPSSYLLNAACKPF